VSTTSSLRDLIYLDFAKATSLWSQLDDGLLESSTTSSEQKISGDAGVSIGIPRLAELRSRIGGNARESKAETRLLHHNLVRYLEDALERGGRLGMVERVADAAEAFATLPYIRVSGKVVFEDYTDLSTIMGSFNELAFLSFNSDLIDGKDIEKLRNPLSSMNNECLKLRTSSSSDTRAKSKEKIAKSIADINKIRRSDDGGIPEWFFFGIQQWIDVFMQDRIIARFTPEGETHAGSAICQLKREAFSDSDSSHTLFTYGGQTTVSLTLFGLITNIPDPHTSDDTLPESDLKEPASEDDKNMADAFSDVFRAMRELGEHMNPVRYPNIGVFPIAIYRSL